MEDDDQILPEWDRRDTPDSGELADEGYERAREMRDERDHVGDFEGEF